MAIPHPIFIDTNTLEETIPHLTPEFPYTTELCDLYDYPSGLFPWHWHAEVEFFYMRTGALEYHIPGAVEIFHEGEGGFINASVPHMTMTHNALPCVQEEHLFLPSLISGKEGSSIESRYVLPITRSQQMDLVRLDPNDVKHAQMIQLMREAFECYQTRKLGYELEILIRMNQLWLDLFHCTGSLQSDHPDMNLGNERIKAMLSHIAIHYAEPLTLKEIADAAYISPRECLRAFRRAINTTPFEYLAGYRIAKAQELLQHTHIPIFEISAACGFANSSYFGKVFRRQIGCSPIEFRKHAQAGNTHDAPSASNSP